MHRRFVGTPVLVIPVLLLLGRCGPPGPAPTRTQIGSLPATAVPSPFPLADSATVTPSATPTPGPTATLVPTFTPAPSRTAHPIPSAIPTVDVRALVIAGTNEYRQGYGCPPLSVHPGLTRAAQKHAEDMAASDFFSHISADGRTLADRVDAVGYHYRLVGENIAAGFEDALEVVDSWMESEEHRKNILNCEFEETGIGYVFVPNDPGQETWKYYWVQVLGAEFE